MNMRMISHEKNHAYLYMYVSVYLSKHNCYVNINTGYLLKNNK